MIYDKNSVYGSYFGVIYENNSKGALPIPEVECSSHLTTCEIVSMDELTVQWIFTVPNDESLSRLISQQTPLNTDKEEC